MTAFDTTISNIQKVLDVINSGQYTAKTQIASAMGVSPALINIIFKRIEHEIYVDGKIYRARCIKVEETMFYKKFSALIPIVLSEPTILFWQNKYISAVFKISDPEAQALRTYVEDIMQSQNGDAK